MADRYTLEDTIHQMVDIVNKAVGSNDFSDMSRQIQKLAGGIKTSVSSGKAPARRNAPAVRKTESPSGYGAKNTAVQKAADPNRALAPYFMPPTSTMGNRVVSILGAAASVLLGTAAAVVGIPALIMGAGGGIAFAGVLAALTAASVSLSVWEAASAGRMERFNKYRALLSGRMYADIHDLSISMNLPEEKVIADLEYMTKKGLIRQGHFDKEKTCFIASHALYTQYLTTAKNAEEQKRLAEERAREEEKYSPKVKDILNRGNEYISKIRKGNDAIDDTFVSEKLDRMERIVRRIFEEVRKRPSLADQLDMFMGYYLPTTDKLVSAYSEMASQEVQGETIRQSEKEIEDSLDMINDAFETLLDSFFKDKALDVSSDISVMKTMLKQDGLTEDSIRNTAVNENTSEEVR